MARRIARPPTSSFFNVGDRSYALRTNMTSALAESLLLPLLPEGAEDAWVASSGTRSLYAALSMTTLLAFSAAALPMTTLHAFSAAALPNVL